MSRYTLRIVSQTTVSIVNVILLVLMERFAMRDKVRIAREEVEVVLLSIVPIGVMICPAFETNSEILIGKIAL